MLIATWNVNSLKVRLPHVIEWIEKKNIDVLCLQETKLRDSTFPVTELAQSGYQSFYSGQAAYNGVAIIVKKGLAVDPVNVVSEISNFPDPHKRLLAITVQNTRFISAYVPNGNAIGTEKYDYKLIWLSKFTKWLRNELRNHEKLAVLGDFNIAPEDQDVYDPIAWEGRILVSQKERSAFQNLIALNLVDAFRLFKQEPKSYSWWDYRGIAFIKNAGLRIDHILLNKKLSEFCTNVYIDKEPRKLHKPSDHTPVIAQLNL